MIPQVNASAMLLADQQLPQQDCLLHSLNQIHTPSFKQQGPSAAFLISFLSAVSCNWPDRMKNVVSIVNNVLTKRIRYVFEKHPLLANSCSGFCVYSIGDVIAQVASRNGDKRLDIKRSMYTGMLGIAMNGFALHVWFRVLDHTFGSALRNKKTAILKCIADQCIYAPFSIAVFFTHSAIKKGGSLEDITQRSQDKMSESFFSTWAADCTLWPFANFINFSFIPINYRPTFTGITQLVWQSYMSTVANTATPPHKEIDNSAILLPKSEPGQSNSKVGSPVGSQVLGESPVLQNKYR